MRKLLVIFGLLFVLGMAQAQTPLTAIYEAVSNAQGVILSEDYIEDGTIFAVVAKPSQYLTGDLVMLMVDLAFIQDGRVIQPWTLDSDGWLSAVYLIYNTPVVVMYDGTVLILGYSVDSRGI